jgi:hypothetical protein
LAWLGHALHNSNERAVAKWAMFRTERTAAGQLADSVTGTFVACGRFQLTPVRTWPSTSVRINLELSLRDVLGDAKRLHAAPQRYARYTKDLRRALAITVGVCQR